jgi:hypothetical protein
MLCNVRQWWRTDAATVRHLMTGDAMKDHFFIASDGELHDTREANWSSRALRQNYSRTHRAITNIADLKATLRAGEYVWPGGYRLAFVTSDGAVLSFGAVRKNFRIVAESIRDDDDNGWLILGVIGEHESDSPVIICDDTGETLWGDMDEIDA